MTLQKIESAGLRIAIGVLYLLGLWLFLSSNAIQPFLLNSDQFSIPSAADDLILNKYFSIFTWSLPRASFAVPDGVIYLLVQMVTRDTLVSIYVMFAIQMGVLIWLLKLMLNSIVGNEAEASVVVCLFLILTCLTLLFPVGALFWMMAFWHFIPLAHAGSMIAALAMFLWFERAFAKGSIILLVFGTVASFALIFSNRFFLTYFSVPYFVTLVVLAFYLRNPKRPAVFLLSQLVASLAIVALSAFNSQPDNAIDLNIFKQLSSFYGAMQMVGASAFVFTAAGIVSFAIVGANIITRLRRWNPDPALLFLFFLGACNLCATFLLWTSPSPSLGRYGSGYQFCFMVFFALILHDVLRRFGLPMAKIVIVASAFLFVFGFLKVGAANFFGPFAARQQLRTEFAACKTRLELKSGLANYWLARYITVMLDWDIQIDQTQPESPTPFLWGSDSEWFYLNIRSGKPIERNFIITNNLKPADVELMYGKPSREEQCGVYRFWLYDDSRQIQDRLIAYWASTDIGRNVSKYLPAEFLGVRADPLR